MDAYFKRLGDDVLREWKSANFSLEKFPSIAQTLVDARPPQKHVKLARLIREFLTNDDQPLQSQSGFGQPEIIAYDHPRFYIQLLFWMDGTTDIHQHEFSGVFHVLHGSSIHAHYDFDNAQSITPHLRVGDVRMKNIELLETGRTTPIISGKSCIHSLFHLDTPSVTMVVRTQHDPGTGPQFNYLPPHVAMDPMHSDTLTMRRKQLLDVMEQTGDPDYATIVSKMIADLDFERGFFILQSTMAHLRDLDEWSRALKIFEQKHGKLAKGIGATLDEGIRRDLIKELRGPINDPEHRFFLALLMNVTARKDLLRLVKQRFPGDHPADIVLRWCAELSGESDFGIEILDALFPQDLLSATDDPLELFLQALKHFISGNKKTPSILRSMHGQPLEALREAFARSALRVLVS